MDNRGAVCLQNRSFIQLAQFGMLAPPHVSYAYPVCRPTCPANVGTVGATYAAGFYVQMQNAYRKAVVAMGLAARAWRTVVEHMTALGLVTCHRLSRYEPEEVEDSSATDVTMALEPKPILNIGDMVTSWSHHALRLIGKSPYGDLCQNMRAQLVQGIDLYTEYSGRSASVSLLYLCKLFGATPSRFIQLPCPMRGHVDF